MKNMTWRRIAIILLLVVAGLFAFGIGYATGATTIAEFMINKIVQIMGYENITIDITMPELRQYYLRLKGG